jgi:hypothetical protein
MSQKKKVSVARDKGKSYSFLNPENSNSGSWIVAADVCMMMELSLNKNFYIFVHQILDCVSKNIISGTFLAKHNIIKDNTPSMPLSDAHLGGFFFYTHG